MDLTTFGINDGYSEAIIRGLRSSFLTEANYNQLKNCNNLQEVKSIMEETDYKEYLQSEPSDMSIPQMLEKLRKKLADEIDYVAAQSVGDLANFIKFIRMSYMIDNTIFMIEGVKNKAPPETLFLNMNPLGFYSEMKNIKVMDGDDFSSLYRDVLIDTPVGQYFMQFLNESLENMGENRTTNEIQNFFREMKAENIRLNLKKLWLEDFFSYTETLNDTTKEMMGELLNMEADFKCVQIVYNSLYNQDVQTQEKQRKLRRQLIPSFGNLYPDCHKALIESDNIDKLRDAVQSVDNYKDVFKDIPEFKKDKKQGNNFHIQTIEDFIKEEENKRYSLAFDQAGQYAVFYAYIKLKEIEISNIRWIAEIVNKSQKKSDSWKKIVIPFSSLKN